MSTTTVSGTTLTPHVPDPPQYSWGRVIAVWAVAAVPMGVAAWILAPALAAQDTGELALMRALVLSLTLGLAWQAAVVAFLVRRETGTLAWSAVRRALWLNRPQSPRTGRVGGRVWIMLLPAALVLILLQAIPVPLAPEDRDLSGILRSAAGAEFFRDNWGWFALLALMLFLNTVAGEELLFRGLLLPRMQRIGGRFAWALNALLFALYHVHQPWTMANVLVSSTVFSYTTQRYRSAWFGIVVHSLQTVVALVLVLGLVTGATAP